MLSLLPRGANRPASAPPAGGSLRASLTRVFSDLLCAYLECSDEVQAEILEMVRIANDAGTDADDRELALATIQEALFPEDRKCDLDADDVQQSSGDADIEIGYAIDALDAQEASFAASVQKLMEARGISQVELASASGVGQPAISMMLARNCRPQRRTVQRIADALGVDANELWPT